MLRSGLYSLSNWTEQFLSQTCFVSNSSTGHWLLFTCDNHRLLMMKQFLCSILYCKYTAGKWPRWVKQPLAAPQTGVWHVEKAQRPITHRFTGWNTHFSSGWPPSSGQSFGNVLRVEYVTVVKSTRLTKLIDAFSHNNPSPKWTNTKVVKQGQG